MVITTTKFKKIRKLHEQGLSEREIARTLKVSRRTVHKYAYGKTMPGKEFSKVRVRTSTVLTDEVKTFINDLLAINKICPRKQRYTARRIFQLLQEKLHFAGSETTVRKYVAEQKKNALKPSVPLFFFPGEDMQVDWGEAYVWIAGIKTLVYLFVATLSYSGAVFVKAYRRQTTECFIDGLKCAFAFFGGVTSQVTCDNGAMAVASGSGKKAEPVEKYEKFASLYAFDMVFCNARSGNEKGRVEAYVGYVRRNWLTGLTEIDSLKDLNYDLQERSGWNMLRTQEGKKVPIEVLYDEEVKALNGIPECQYDFSDKRETHVTNYCTVTYDSNSYSVPFEYCGKNVVIAATPEDITVYHQGDVIAQHERCFDKNRTIYDIDHYLGLLKVKKRAIMNAKPVMDNFPSTFITWLNNQNFNEKELFETIARASAVGCDVVMSRDIAPVEKPETAPTNEVPVIETELSPYDNLIPSSKEGTKDNPSSTEGTDDDPSSTEKNNNGSD